MRITESQLRRIVRRMVEATRDPANMESDLESMRPGDQIELEAYSGIYDVQEMVITKRPATRRDMASYDMDSSAGAFIYTLKDANGRKVMSSVYPSEISNYFESNEMEFAY